jgi:hypothetical protein
MLPRAGGLLRPSLQTPSLRLRRYYSVVVRSDPPETRCAKSCCDRHRVITGLWFAMFRIGLTGNLLKNREYLNMLCGGEKKVCSRLDMSNCR